jgi:hypothetical protein
MAVGADGEVTRRDTRRLIETDEIVGAGGYVYRLLANRHPCFATELLIPAAELRRAFPDRFVRKEDVLAFSKRLKVAPRIVVGRLQHEGILPPTHPQWAETHLAFLRARAKTATLKRSSRRSAPAANNSVWRWRTYASTARSITSRHADATRSDLRPVAPEVAGRRYPTVPRRCATADTT